MNQKRIEIFKTVLLVVLFFTTILLLYLLWTRDSGARFSVSELLHIENRVVESVDTDDVLIPQYVAFGNSDGSYSLASGDLNALQRKAVGLIKEALDASQPTMNEIPEEQYDRSLSGFNSVQIRTCVDFPGRSIASHFGFHHGEVFESIPYVSIFAFSDASKESLLMADLVNGKYYRIIFESENDFVAKLRSGTMSDGNIYYLSESILGGSGKALIPLEAESKLDYADYETEFGEDKRDLRVNMAEAVFGENFDFVRRITDSFGNISYMYGYGQKVLSANTDGSFEYTEDTAGGSSQGFFTDLETAVDFACECGGWVYEGENSALKLSDYQVSGSGRDTVRSFEFTQLVGGNEICLESGPALRVTVAGGHVSSLFRSIAVNTGAQYSVDTFKVSDAINVIAENCDHIYNIINNNTLAAATDEALSFASDAVSAVRVAYFRSSRDTILYPCWKVDTNAGVTFYFDLYTAAPLGFTR